MKIDAKYNEIERQLELIYTNGDISSACFLKDEWEYNYKVESLMAWFNSILKKVEEDYDDLLESRTELAELVGIR